MSTSSSKMKTRTLIIPAAILVVVAIVLVPMLTKGDSNSASNQPTYTVTRAPLAISLTESGTIKSRDQFVVKSEVEGRTSILYVIDEGVQVKKGELLIELDSSELNDRLVDQQIMVENTAADYISAKENLAVVKIQAESNIAQAKLNNQFAIEDKTKYIDGEWPKALMEADTDVKLAQEDFRRATDEFDWSKKLYEEQYLSETEYRADELALKRSELQVALANENLKLLKEYTQPRRIAELESEITQTTLSLERVNRESASDIAQAQAREKAREAELNRQKTRLAKIEDQLAKTKLYAPADGMVVYATSSEFSWRGDTEPLDEGQEVRERQELIHLPTADSMMVVIQVHESALGKVKIGQRAELRVDALPDQTFTGVVTKLAPLPDAQSVFMNPDLKVYDTQIMIDGVHPNLRTGMSCQAIVRVESHDDALAVPMQAVVGRNGQSVVYVMENGQPTPRNIETGLDNNALVHVISGLNAGEKVLLTPPLAKDQGSKRAQRPSTQTPTASEPSTGKPSTDKPATNRPTAEKPSTDAPSTRPQRSRNKP